ncbi:hypothetical protein D9M72_588220 [compost metagenome]
MGAVAGLGHIPVALSDLAFRHGAARHAYQSAPGRCLWLLRLLGAVGGLCALRRHYRFCRLSAGQSYGVCLAQLYCLACFGRTYRNGGDRRYRAGDWPDCRRHCLLAAGRSAQGLDYTLDAGHGSGDCAYRFAGQESVRLAQGVFQSPQARGGQGRTC